MPPSTGRPSSRGSDHSRTGGEEVDYATDAPDVVHPPRAGRGRPDGRSDRAEEGLRRRESADADRTPARIWRDPGDIASLDLTYGAGGRAHAPDPAGTFTFVKEDAAATNPKFEVTDGHGVEWKVKLGQESQPETAATRFLWAAGYFSDEDYYVPTLTVKGLPELQRGREFVVPRRRRPRRPPRTEDGGRQKLGDWDWFDNPFLGRRELNGLRVMMSLVNNWDLKQVNNSIYAVNGERRYVVSDAGASFGRTGTGGMNRRACPRTT